MPSAVMIQTNPALLTRCSKMLTSLIHFVSGTVPITGCKRSPHAERLAWHVRTTLVSQGPPCFPAFKESFDLRQSINKIPLHRTKQIPCRAMESTQDGNREVVETLLNFVQKPQRGRITDRRDHASWKDSCCSGT